MFRTTTTALAIALSLAAAGANAQPSVPVQMSGGGVSRTVHFGDLDLGSHSGVKELAFRIRTAARYVCGGDDALTRADIAFQPCVSGAIGKASDTLGMASLDKALGRTSVETNLVSR